MKLLKSFLRGIVDGVIYAMHFAIAYLFATNVETIVFDTIGKFITVADGTTVGYIVSAVSFILPFALAYLATTMLAFYAVQVIGSYISRVRARCKKNTADAVPA